MVHFMSTPVSDHRHRSCVHIHKETQIRRRFDCCSFDCVSRHTVRFDLCHSVVRFGESVHTVSFTNSTYYCLLSYDS